MFLSAREAEPVALAYAAQGYHAFVLCYSVGKEHHWPQPLEDAQEAMQDVYKRQGYDDAGGAAPGGQYFQYAE